MREFSDARREEFECAPNNFDHSAASPSIRSISTNTR
jgi:hypothetical protein